MSDRLRAAFARQGAAPAKLSSPFMVRLIPLIGARLDAPTPVDARCLVWPGDVTPSSGLTAPLWTRGAPIRHPLARVDFPGA